MKGILSKISIIFLTAFISVQSFAIEEEKDNKKLGEDDLVADFIINVNPSDSVKRYAVKNGFKESNIEENNLMKIYNEKVKDSYIDHILTVFFILFAVCIIFAIAKIAAQRKNNSNSNTGSSFLSISGDLLVFLSSFGGITSLFGTAVFIVILYIAKMNNGLLGDTFDAYSNAVSKENSSQIIVADTPNEFNNIADIAIAEKRTLQARIVKLLGANDYKDLSVNEFAKTLSELEKFKAGKDESWNGFTNSYSIISPSVEGNWYSIGKDTQNYEAFVSTIKFKNERDFTSGELNISNDSRSSIVKDIVAAESMDTFAVYEKLKSEYKSALESGKTNIDLEKYVPEIEKAIYSDVNNFTGEYESTSELVNDATFLFDFAASKYKGLDNNNTVLKFYKDLSLSADAALELHCSNRESLRKNKISAFEKFTSSGKDVQDALIEARDMDFDCLTIKDGSWKLYGFNEDKESEKMKAVMIDFKSKTLAGTALYNIINSAKSRAQNKFINANKDIGENIDNAQRIGMAGAMANLDTIGEMNFSIHKIRNSKSALDITNNISQKFIAEEALFGLTEEDKNSYSINDRKSVLDKFNQLNLRYLYDSEVVLNKVNTDSIILNETSSVSTAKDIGESVLSAVMLGTDGILKYSLGTPHELNISKGIEYCEKNDCSGIYKPSLYEIQVFGGKELAETSFICLSTIYGVRAANELLDVSAQATIGEKFLSLGKGFVGKGLKVALGSANAVGEVYEPVCLTTLVVGITSGYVAPTFQKVMGIFIVATLLITLIALVVFAPFAPLINAATNIVNIDNGYNSGITKNYLKMVFGYLILLTFFTPLVLIVLSFMAYQPYSLFTSIIKFTGEDSLLMVMISVALVVILSSAMIMLIVSMLPKLLNAIAGALNINTRISDVGESKLVQISTGSMIATKVAGFANASFGTLTNVLQQNNREKEIIQNNEKKLLDIATKKLEEATANGSDIKDEGVKKLKDLLDDMNKNKKT